jgi:crotonobetainyl-CoA:carnitine CoA-transferase CaiB-like acyl-CoA transferase
MVTRTSIDGEDVTRLGLPMKTSLPIEETMEPGPALGEHTVGVFQRVLDDETVDGLRAEGVLHGP